MSFVETYATDDAVALAARIRAKEVSPREAVAAAFAAIDRVDPALNAVIMRMEAQAEEQLAALDRLDPAATPLYGVPVLLKDDCQSYAGVPSANASRLAAGFTRDYDTEIMARYRKAGVIVVGKTNLPEYGSNATTEPVANGPTHNPWKHGFSVGGSSGGSSAAVAAGMVPVAYANDGAGSIRCPASSTGTFGLKPSRARTPAGPVSWDLWGGLVSEHVITRSGRDSALMLDLTDGPDVGAPYFAPPKARPWIEELAAAPGRLKIALSLTPPVRVEVTEDVRAVTLRMAKLLEEMGHEVVEAVPVYDGEAVAEALKLMLCAYDAAQIDDLSKVMGRPVDRSTVEGGLLAAAARGRATPAPALLDARGRMGAEARRFCRFFGDYDLLMTPTLPQAPMAHGYLDSDGLDLDTYLNRVMGHLGFTHIANVTGQPAMSVPGGFSDGGLPVGVQFIARPGDEATLFRLAARIEEAAPWARHLPPVHASRG